MGDGSGIPRKGPVAHSYIVCENPWANQNTRQKFGKHPYPFSHNSKLKDRIVGPGYVNRETGRIPSNADCKKMLVCPEDKNRMCQEGPTREGYNLGLDNCHDWANLRSE